MTHEARNAQLFGILCRAVAAQERDGVSPEAVADAVRRAASFARFHFPGTLADAGLEGVLRRLGTEHLPPWNAPVPSGPVRRVLHVATALQPTGGHSRVVLNWIRRDPGREHRVAVTDQLPGPDLLAALEGAGATLPVLALQASEAGACERAARLREFVERTGADAVVLHIHPQDVVAPMALANAPVPVAFFDHGDHVFSLGRLYSDLVVTFRDVAAWHPAGHPRALLLPLPVQPPAGEPAPWMHPEPSGPVLLSMGSAYKYTPMGGHNFFRTVADVLDAAPEAVCYVVGVDRPAAEEMAGGALHPRLHPVGRVSNPAEYLRRAWYFLEPFPSGTCLGTLDAVAEGAVPVFNYVTINVFNVSARSVLPPGLQGMLPTYGTAAAYVGWVADELRTGEFRRTVGPAIRAFVHASSVDGWTASLEAVYERLRALRDTPLDEDDVRQREAHASAFAGHSRWAEFRGDPMQRFVGIARGIRSPRDRWSILAQQARSIRRGHRPRGGDLTRLVRLLAGR